MSVLWERLSGNTDIFAFKVAFHGDPHEGKAATVEQRASWGAFQIWVHGQNLSSHIEEGESVDSARWYLVSLLEWLAKNWDPLFHEERLPAENAAADAWSSLRSTRFPPPGLDDVTADSWSAAWSSWWARHSLQACRDGGLFPDVVFRRWRDKVEVSWGQSKIAGTPSDFRFTAPSGTFRFEPPEVAAPVYDVLKEAAAWLAEQSPPSERFAKLRKTVDAIPQQNPNTRLAWLAGLGEDIHAAVDRWEELPKRLVDVPSEAIAAVFDALADPLVIQGSSHAALLFGSVSPLIEEADVLCLAKEMVSLYSPTGELGELAELIKNEPLSQAQERPWEQGYELATSLLETLGLNETREPIDLSDLLKRFGILCKDISLSDSAIRGASIAGKQHRPAVLANANCEINRRRWGRRFTLAHELCHTLFDRSYGGKLALASGPWAPRDVEQRANAFAAMFLMPTELVRYEISRLDSPLASLEGVTTLAHSLETSARATLAHLCNLGFLDEPTRDRIQDDMEARCLSPDSAGLLA